MVGCVKEQTKSRAGAEDMGGGVDYNYNYGGRRALFVP